MEENLKLFVVTPSRAGYIDDDGVVIIAESEEQALEIAKRGSTSNDLASWDFRKEQYPLKVVEVKMNKAVGVLASNVGA